MQYTKFYYCAFYCFAYITSLHTIVGVLNLFLFSTVQNLRNSVWTVPHDRHSECLCCVSVLRCM